MQHFVVNAISETNILEITRKHALGQALLFTKGRR